MRILLFLFMAINIYAAQITPVSVTASSTMISYNSLQLIDDSGLSGGLHDSDWRNMWMSVNGAIPATLTFDLGSSYYLASADIWQYSSAAGITRGVQDFDIYVSADNISFTYVGPAAMTMASVTALPAQTIPVGASGRYVRLVLNTNFGASYIGLAEVKFNSATLSVPLSATSKFVLMLLFAMAAMLGMKMRARALGPA